MTAKRENGKLRTNNIYFILIFFILAAMASQNSIRAQQGKQWVIVIDPGHGGRDPGAVGPASREKDINLGIALKTGAYIEKNIPNVKVVYTRKTDVTVDLFDRPVIANENKADLFISIHTNKTSSKSVMGAETFVMGLSKDDQNLEIAMKENEVMLLEDDYSTKYQGFDPKSPESYIMFTLMQNVYLRQSTNLASKIQTQFTERVSRRDRGVKQAGFWVLFNTTMPSVLIETGFISNPAEEKFLTSAQGQDYMASAIYRACREYISEISVRSIAVTDLKRDTAMLASISEPASSADNPVPPVTLTSGSKASAVDSQPAPAALPAKITQPAAEITYMVQVSSSSVRISIKAENFKGRNDISEIQANNAFKYASGRFANYSEALNHRKALLSKFPGAFVIAVKENKIIPLQEALGKMKKN